jgi:hypothetical protein
MTTTKGARHWLTGGWWTEHYSSSALTVSRYRASGPHGEPVWVVIGDQEALERWLNDGNNVGGEQWPLELMSEKEKGGRAQWRGVE